MQNSRLELNSYLLNNTINQEPFYIGISWCMLAYVTFQEHVEREKNNDEIWDCKIMW